MRSFSFSFAWAASGMVVATHAQGSERLFVNAAAFYAIDETKYDDVKADRTALFYHLGGGLRLTSGILVGGKYVKLDEDVASGNSASGNALSGYGLLLGYQHSSGFAVAATYLFEPEREVSAGNDVRAVWNGGNGSVIDVGYYFDRGDWAIGPQLSMVNATYKSVRSAGLEVEIDSPYEETFTYPHVSLWFYF